MIKFVLALQGDLTELHHLATQYVKERRIADPFLYSIARVLGAQPIQKQEGMVKQVAHKIAGALVKQPIHRESDGMMFLEEVRNYFALTTPYKDNIPIKQKIDEQTQKFIDYVPTILTSETMYELGYRKLFALNAKIAKIIDNIK